MSLPEILAILATSLWCIAILTVFRPVVKGWRTNPKAKPTLDKRTRRWLSFHGSIKKL